MLVVLHPDDDALSPPAADNLRGLGRSHRWRSVPAL